MMAHTNVLLLLGKTMDGCLKYALFRVKILTVNNRFCNTLLTEFL